MKLYHAALAGVLLSKVALSECPNGCSGHGTCEPKDKCDCYKGFMANDCSERVCQFGNAHVDTPFGDLDMDGTVEFTADVISGSTVFPYGINEKFTELGANAAHYYMECSNRGICDRETGLCECFAGYEGTACRRASCPNQCSGHGTCESVKELGLMNWKLHADYTGAGRSSYTLWDADLTLGCKCDPQFFGADCSLKKCKYGVDPLYSSEDDGVAQFTIDNDGSNTDTYKLSFYQRNSTDAAYGRLYSTAVLTAGTMTDKLVEYCDTLINALYAATDEDGVKVAASELKGLKCVGYQGTQAANDGIFRLTYPAEPGILQTLYWNTVTIDTALALDMQHKDGSTCVAKPVYESIIIEVDSATPVGDYRLKFYDVFGEDYVTTPITATKFVETLTSASSDSNIRDTCNEIHSAFTQLPNGVISEVQCKASITGTKSYYTVTFNANPGVLKPVMVHDSSALTTGTVKVGSGQTTGEFIDEFANTDVCKWDTAGNAYDVLMTSGSVTTVTVKVGGTDEPCNPIPGANEVVKVGDRHLMTTGTATTLAYAYNGMDVLRTEAETMFVSTRTYTEATAQVDVFNFGDSTFECDMDCSEELKQGNIIFLENQYFTVQYASPYDPYTVYVDRPFGGKALDRTNIAAAQKIYYSDHTQTVAGTYEYVTQCSNRGTCNYESGLCECYSGYAGDNCSIQNALFAV